MLCTKCGQEYEGSQCPRCDGPVILVNNSDYLARRKAYEEKQALKERSASSDKKEESQSDYGQPCYIIYLSVVAYIKSIILLSCKLVYSKCCDTNKHYCYQHCRYHFHSFVYFMSCNSYLWLFLITIPVATCFSATLSLLSAVRFASVLTLLLTFCLV